MDEYRPDATARKCAVNRRAVMKNFAMLVATIGLMIPVSFTAPMPAYAKANPNVAFCKDYISDPLIPDDNLNLGECISQTTVGNIYYNKGKAKHAFAVHICDYYAENYPDDFATLWGGSKSACIADVESTL
jgi:hypothetical protein